MNRTRLVTWIAVALIVAAGVAAWRWYAGAGDADRYRTASVDRGPIRVAIAATGNLKAVITVDVGSQLSGQIRSVEGDFNQRVAKDQPIAHMDPATFQARVTQAQADLASAEASAQAARAARAESEATLKNAERDLVRKQEIKAKGLIAQTDVDAAQLLRDQSVARRESAGAQIAVADANVKQKRAGLANAELDLERTVIRAPIEGVVVMRNVQPGQTVAASLQTPVLFQIAENLREMELNLAIDESDVGQVHEGLPTTFTVDAFPNREFKGRVKQIRLAAVTTQNVVTYPVMVAVDNADLTLLPGMTANAEIEAGGSADALRVPNAALRFRPPEGTPGAVASAQGSGGRGSGGGQRDFSALKQRLELSSEQEQKFDEAVAALRQRMEARRAAREGQGEGEGAGAGEQAQPPGGGGRGDGRGEGPGGGRGEGARGGYQDALKTALAPLRESLSEAQRATLDAELGGMGARRRVTLWTLERGRLKPVEVRVGVSDGEHTELLGDALKPGDVVVTGLMPTGG